MTRDGEFSFQFEERSLAGHSVIVSGGSGGLGSAVSVLLARHGASLVIGYRSNSERAERLRRYLEESGTQVRTVGGDIIHAETRCRLTEAGKGLGGGLYGLVCLAGDPARVKFDSASPEDLERSFHSNFSGPLLLVRDFAAALGTERPGSICLFSTMQAVETFPSSLVYAAPKCALLHSARILAKQWGGSPGIRVNVVAPGVNRAGMALESIASGKYHAYVEQGIISRFGRPEDAARVVRLLMEPDGYVTGQVITVDGGLTLRKEFLRS